jgi:hypothetical protein
MTPELKDKWIAALRSGEYQQTRGALRRLEPEPAVQAQDEDGKWLVTEAKPAGYCCLGVLLDVSKLGTFGADGTFTYSHPRAGQLVDDDDRYDNEVYPDLETLDEQCLDNTLLGELGLRSELQNKLIDLNDDALLPFAAIADHLQAVL